jgi:hypothetical protein
VATRLGTRQGVPSPGDDMRLTDWYLVIAARAAIDLACVIAAYPAHDPVGVFRLRTRAQRRSSRRANTSPGITRPKPGARCVEPR